MSSGGGGSGRRTAIPQPSYDFLGGEGGAGGSNGRSGSTPPPRALRQTFRQSSRPPAAGIVATADNEELRAQLKSAQYEIESLKQDREMARIRYEKELRDAASRADADFKKAQNSESNKAAAAQRTAGLAKELAEVQERAAGARRELERRARTAEEQGKEAREEADEARTELEAQERAWSHRFTELERKHETLQRTMREARSELDGKTSNLEAAQQRLRSRETELGELEKEVLQLRTAGGDLEELSTVRTQLSDQMEHIRKLEMANRDQTAELRRLRQVQKSAAILEEEKRTLQLRLGKLDDVEKELDEARYQRQLLLDERQAWAAYLQDEIGEGQEPEFDSPEAVARALRSERIEKASLLERLGAVKPELLEKESLVQSLEEEKSKLQQELSKLRSAAGSGAPGGNRAQVRLERQKVLALKEIEYLRDQLKTFDAEDITGEIPTDADQAARERISELEELVAQYRAELDTVTSQLNSFDTPAQAPVMASLKRPAPDAENEVAAAQVGELSRKIRKLQQELVESQTAHKTLKADNSVLKTQVSTLQASARTRVLSLRNNPTDDFESRKLSTIDLLRRENAALQAQLGGQVGSRRRGDVVPAESLEEAKIQLEECQALVKSKEKHNVRLKEIFAAKSQEMREAVASLLGWNVEFQTNGRFKLTSIFAEEGRSGRDKNVERYMTFHGEKGMMTIAGGPDGHFGREIKKLIEFWVEDRGEIPGFLAAYTLENLDRRQ